MTKMHGVNSVKSNKTVFEVEQQMMTLSDYDQNTCVPCQPNCASCQERPDHCTSCDHHLVLHDNKCYAACPTYTFETEDYGYVFLIESALYTPVGHDSSVGLATHYGLDGPGIEFLADPSGRAV